MTRARHLASPWRVTYQWSGRMRQTSSGPSERQLDGWFRSPMGRAVLACERRVVSQMVETVFGGHLLQIGCWPSSSILSHCRVQHRMIVDPTGPADLVSELDQLPIASGSIDVVFIPHSLAFSPNPHGIIREADRVLGRGGHLILLGFSPLSFWGLRGLCRQPPFRQSVQMMAERRIGDWMQLLGLEVIRMERYLYRLPFSNGWLIRRSRFLEGWGHSLLPGPWPAAAYAALFQKRDLGGNIIRPEWRRRQQRLRRPAAVPDSFEGQRNISGL